MNPIEIFVQVVKANIETEILGMVHLVRTSIEAGEQLNDKLVQLPFEDGNLESTQATMVKAFDIGYNTMTEIIMDYYEYKFNKMRQLIDPVVVPYVQLQLDMAEAFVEVAT